MTKNNGQKGHSLPEGWEWKTIGDVTHAKGPSIAIGSSPLKSEIVLPDPDIAPQHAMLRGDGSQFTVRDMSLSGTFINNRKIERVQLADGQRTRMGNTEMVYHERR